MKFDEFKFILRNLCNKIDKYLEIHETLVFDYFLENIELTGSIVFGKENMEVNMEIFKKALSNLTLHYRYFLILIVKTF